MCMVLTNPMYSRPFLTFVNKELEKYLNLEVVICLLTLQCLLQLSIQFFHIEQKYSRKTKSCFNWFNTRQILRKAWIICLKTEEISSERSKRFPREQ
jgi:hypothetical protein